MARKSWTTEEKKYITENHLCQSVNELAKALGRNVPSVGSFLRAHGLSRVYEKRRWSKAEVFRLYLFAERYGPRLIAKKMKRSLTEVQYKIRHLQLKTRSEVYSQVRAREVTGYHEYQLQRARDALGQVWRREVFRRDGTRPKTRFTITQKQLDALCEHLKTDPWKYTKKSLRAA